MSDKPKINVTPASLDRLLDDLRALAADDHAALDADADGADDAETQWLRRESAAWDGPAGEARLGRLGRKLRWASLTPQEAFALVRQGIDTRLQSLRAGFMEVVPAGEIVDDGDPVLRSGETDDGMLRWRIVRAPGGDLCIEMWSWATALEGTRVRLQAGDWHGEGVLVRRAPDDVGARVVLAAEDRARLSDVVGLSIVFEPADAGRL